MKLVSIRMENVRRFVEPETIDGIDEGLNLICEPNETGKSTIFDALYALFFMPHRTTKDAVKKLQPHAGGAPEVAVEVETPEGRFRIEKRWLSRPNSLASSSFGSAESSASSQPPNSVSLLSAMR